MKTLTIGKLKAHFSKVLSDIKNGDEYIVEYGKKREKLAVIFPYSKYKKKNNLKFGLLKKKGKISLKKDFKITEKDFLSL